MQKMRERKKSLTLGAHAQQGRATVLSVRVFVCLSVMLILPQYAIMHLRIPVVLTRHEYIIVNMLHS